MSATNTMTTVPSASHTNSIPEMQQFCTERGIDCSDFEKKSHYISAVRDAIEMEQRAVRECENPTIVDVTDLSARQAKSRYQQHLRALLPETIQVTVESETKKSKGTGNSIIRFQLTLTGHAWMPTASLWNALIQSFLIAHHPQFNTVENSISYHSRQTPSDMTKEEYELTEFFDTEQVYRAKIMVLARIMTLHKNTVVYTGAGISTAAKIADFRGPNGVWTARDFNRPKAKSVAFENAKPTLTHWLVKHGIDSGLFRYCTSQNVDGLHRRSGIPVSHLSELHGNSFREICVSCKADHIREFRVKSKSGPYFQDVKDFTKISHITGRKCESCGEGMLRDSVIHFNEDIPEKDLERSEKHGKASYLSLCMGSSLRVTPAADLPEQCRGPMVIVNLQATGRDQECLSSGGFIIHTKTDTVSALLCQSLSIPLTSLVPSTYKPPDDFKPLYQSIIQQQQQPSSKQDAREEKELPTTMKQMSIIETSIDM